MLLNTAKYEGYSLCRLSYSGKTNRGGGGKNYPKIRVKQKACHNGNNGNNGTKNVAIKVLSKLLK